MPFVVCKFVHSKQNIKLFFNGLGADLLAAAFMSLKAISHLPFITEFSDMLSRFSGITMCSITTGVIWISEPES